MTRSNALADQVLTALELPQYDPLPEGPSSQLWDIANDSQLSGFPCQGDCAFLVAVEGGHSNKSHLQVRQVKPHPPRLGNLLRNKARLQQLRLHIILSSIWKRWRRLKRVLCRQIRSPRHSCPVVSTHADVLWAITRALSHGLNNNCTGPEEAMRNYAALHSKAGTGPQHSRQVLQSVQHPLGESW